MGDRPGSPPDTEANELWEVSLISLETAKAAVWPPFKIKDGVPGILPKAYP